MNKVDAGIIEEVDIIQGIRNALLLLGNVSRQHSLQQQKMILQHLNPQLKSLVQDACFTKAPLYLFDANFGELAKEQLEATALIQKTQIKSTAPNNTRLGATRVVVEETVVPAEEGTGMLGVQSGLETFHIHVNNFLDVLYIANRSMWKKFHRPIGKCETFMVQGLLNRGGSILVIYIRLGKVSGILLPS